jgi:hypothetical protein
MRCLNCDAEIPKARLEVIPWTQHCVLCALEIEVQKTSIMERACAYIDQAFKFAERVTGAEVFQEDKTPEQTADERAGNLLCRQIERIEGFQES